MPVESPIRFHLVKLRLENACNEVLNKDLVLLELGVNERTVTQRLALYLQSEFIGYAVDCEYNRNMRDSKTLPVEPKDVRSDDVNAVTVYPDVIVHQRGHHRSNLLVIEAKKNATTDSVPEHDAKKLEGFTDNDGKFKYHWGAFLNFYRNGGSAVFQIKWYWLGLERTESEVRDAVQTSMEGSAHDI